MILSNNSSSVKYQKIVSLKPRKRPKIRNPSICSTEYCQYVFLTGGQGRFGNHGRTVERYDLNREEWQVMPSLNIGRVGHASCTLGSHVFVFCGKKNF